MTVLFEREERSIYPPSGLVQSYAVIFFVRKNAMRRSNKELNDKGIIINLLRTCHVGRLATITAAEYPR